MNIAIFASQAELVGKNLSDDVILIEKVADLSNFENGQIGTLIVAHELLESEITVVAKFVLEQLCKLLVDSKYRERWSHAVLDQGMALEFFDDLLNLSVLNVEIERELQKHGVDLAQVGNYAIAENERLQSAVNRVYKNEEELMSADKNDGLSFSRPEDDDLEEVSSIDIELDLSSDDELEGESTQENIDLTQEDDLNLSIDSSEELSLSDGDDSPSKEISDLDEDAMDLGEVDSSISLSSKEDSIDELNDNKQLEEDGLDFGSLDSSISLAEDGDAIDEFNAGSQDEDGALDLDEVNAALNVSSDSLEDDSLEDDSLEDDSLEDDSLEDDSLDIDDDDLGELDELEDDLEDTDVGDLESEALSVSSTDQESLEDDVGEQTAKTVVGNMDEVLSQMVGKVEPEDGLSKDMAKQGLQEETTGQFASPLSKDFSSKQAYESTEKIDVGKLINSSQTTEQTESIQEESSPKQLLGSLSSSELLDLKVTLGELKNDRKNLLGKICTEEENNDRLREANLTLKADIDEMKIELSILKKRHLAELTELSQKLSLSQEKRDILDAKNRGYQREMDRLGHKLRIDFSKVKQRETELAGQLELATMDSDSKVKTRDTKILELKRKIDSLEFNMESVSIQDRQSRGEKVLLEDKLSKVVSTLRNSLSFLEEEVDVKDLKKHLDI